MKEIYTKYQLSVLNGDIPFDEVRASTYSSILKTAEEHGDGETVERVRPLYFRKQEANKAKRKEVNRAYYAGNRSKWVKSPAYTQRQNDILAGKIPFKDACVSDYKRILKTATELNDEETASKMRKLIARKEKYKTERKRQQSRRSYYRTNAKGEEGFTETEISILNGEIEFSKVSSSALKRLKDKAERANAENVLSAVDLITTLKTDPRQVYIEMLGYQPVIPDPSKK